MLVLKLHTEEEGAFEDFQKKEIIHLKEGVLRVAALEKGMTSGKPAVAFGFEIGDGKVVLAETSLALFLSAADALRARFKISDYALTHVLKP